MSLRIASGIPSNDAAQIPWNTAINPCKLKRGSLPMRTDKDVKWRSTAIFTRREIEQIFVDDRIPWDRRMCYAACYFAGGARFGEAAARRWRDYDRERDPLGFDRERVVLETLTGIHRTDADIIITYHAPYAARLLAKR